MITADIKQTRAVQDNAECDTQQHSVPCVLVGVTGCIAAYKACEIVRGLQKAGIRVKVVMTQTAAQFVTPHTFRALTREPVGLGLFDDPSDPIHHISLAQEADIFLIAPCTANVMAKLAHGIADDLLTSTALAHRSPLMIAPAMNVGMYENAATQENLEVLRQRGHCIIEPDFGYQACGDEGKGRLPEPADIVAAVLCELDDRDLLDAITEPGQRSAARGAHAANGEVCPSSMNAESDSFDISEAEDFQEEGPEEEYAGFEQDFADKTVLITAGPTVEPIDSVRYISNYSSGKFGYAIADAAAQRGARVILVSGPVALDAPDGVERIDVKTAQDMFDACTEEFPQVDIAICAAAVADVRPAVAATRKLKKGKDDAALSTIELVQNPDILATLGSEKDHQIVVGFAAETDDVIQNAKLKLMRKGADMIVANDVSGGKAFGSDSDEVTLVKIDDCIVLEAAPKAELAHKILDAIK